MEQSLVAALVVGLAAYRVALLVARDTIAAPLRQRIGLLGYSQYDGRPRPGRGWARWTHQLVTCPMCVSVWTALGGTAVVEGWPWSDWDGGRWLLLALAAAGVAAALLSIGAD